MRVTAQSRRADFDDAVDDARLVRADRLVGRRRQCGARAQAEARAVARANDDVAFDRAAGELAAVVRAHVVDRVELAAMLNTATSAPSTSTCA